MYENGDIIAIGAVARRCNHESMLENTVQKLPLLKKEIRRHLCPTSAVFLKIMWYGAQIAEAAFKDYGPDYGFTSDNQQFWLKMLEKVAKLYWSLPAILTIIVSSMASSWLKVALNSRTIIRLKSTASLSSPNALSSQLVLHPHIPAVSGQNSAKPLTMFLHGKNSLNPLPFSVPAISQLN